MKLCGFDVAPGHGGAKRAVTKSGNPLPRRGSCTLWVCDKSHVELTLRVMPPDTEIAMLGVLYQDNEVAA